MPNIDEQEDFLRKKIDESTVDFSDKYWEQAKLLLDIKHKRRFGAWWMSAIILLSLGSAVFYFKAIKPSRSGQKIAVTSHEPVSKSANSTTIVNTNPLNKKEKQKQSSMVTLSHANAATSKSIAFITNKKATKHFEKSAGKKAYVNAANSTVHGIQQAPQGTGAKSNTPETASSSVNATAGNSADRTIEANATANEQSTIQNNIQKTEDKSANEVAAGSPPLKDIGNSTSIESSNAYEATKTNPAISPDTTKQLLKDTARVVSIPQAVNKVDTASVHPESKGIYRNKILSVSAGCNFNKGINAGGNALNVGALPYLGVSYAMVITHNNRGMIQWGLQLNMNNHLNSQIQVHHSNYYSFGYGKPGESVLAPPTPVSDTVFTLNQQLLFTLQLPVEFDYYINGKNSFSVGAGVAYTLGIYNKVINFNGTETNSFGYNQGYNPYAFLQAGYCYNFTRNWAVELTIQQGLTDITNNSFFKSNSIDRITNLQIGLKREFAIKSKKVQYDKK